MTDQHRWDALGCANPVVRTPHLDALAAQGIRYGQAICNVPCCIPSRYSMMTGLYAEVPGAKCSEVFVIMIVTLIPQGRVRGYTRDLIPSSSKQRC